MEPNLSQALHLLNGETVQRKIIDGGVIKRLVEQKLTPQQIVEELYLRCLSRRPTGEEAARLNAVVSAPGADAQAALQDVFWALLNSKEFVFSH